MITNTMIDFHAVIPVWTDRQVELRGVKKDISGKAYAMHSIKFVERQQGELFNPFITLELEEAQKLIDTLYSVGLRPSAAAGSAGQLDAVKYHLEDMRQLVFNKGKS